MEILIVGTLLILIVWYLIKTNNSNKLAENKSVFVFTFQTIFKGFTLYSIVGYLLASIIIKGRFNAFYTLLATGFYK